MSGTNRIEAGFFSRYVRGGIPHPQRWPHPTRRCRDARTHRCSFTLRPLTRSPCRVIQQQKPDAKLRFRFVKRAPLRRKAPPYHGKAPAFHRAPQTGVRHVQKSRYGFPLARRDGCARLGRAALGAEAHLRRNRRVTVIAHLQPAPAKRRRRPPSASFVEKRRLSGAKYASLSAVSNQMSR